MKESDKDDTKQAEELTSAIEDLDKNIEELDQNITQLNKGFKFWPTFGRGIVGSLGALIGATIIISLLLYLLQRLAVLPIIGEIFKLALDQLKSGPPTP
jgi:hypothetical protein